MNINDLNKQFGQGNSVYFELINNEIIVARVNTSQCTATVSLQGAQLIEWTPVNHKPVIWLSEDASFAMGKSIRGGIPVCWPWFGAHKTNQSFPAHGFARTVAWTLLDCSLLGNGSVMMRFRLNRDPGTDALWPLDTPLELSITMGEVISLELVTRNNENKPIEITEALHTYFAVSDVQNVTIKGLADCDYLDKVQNFSRFTQKGDVGFIQETDRVYVDTDSECIIEDHNWQRHIHISKSGSHSTVVWNPWQDRSLEMGDMGEAGYLRMLCLESANAANNMVTIEPGDEHKLCVQYIVKQLTSTG